MARNYNKETDWEKDKYIRFQCKLPREEYEEILKQIKEYGNARFLSEAIEKLWTK